LLIISWLKDSVSIRAFNFPSTFVVFPSWGDLSEEDPERSTVGSLPEERFPGVSRRETCGKAAAAGESESENDDSSFRPMSSNTDLNGGGGGGGGVVMSRMQTRMKDEFKLFIFLASTRPCRKT
jgi:hypothetical protein